MKNYYLIPMISNDIYFNNKSLESILEASHPELVEMERERIGILYSVRPIDEMPKSVEKRYDEHVAEMKKMFDEAQVPRFLIAYGNDHCAKEILTKTKITPKYPAALRIRRVNKEKIEEYFASSDYATKISRYFSDISTYESPFQFTDAFEIEGYIEGKIGERDIRGIFNGEIKIKSLIKR